jgi:acetyltransferase-like isoleucine patch superfamily enzyme
MFAPAKSVVTGNNEWVDNCSSGEDAGGAKEITMQPEVGGVAEVLTTSGLELGNGVTMSKSKPHTFEDPLRTVLRALRKLNSLWLRWTYPFASVGHHFSVHYSCDLRRTVARYIRIGDSVLIERNCRIDVPVTPKSSEPVILLDDDCRIGQGVTILAINRIHIGRNVIFGQSALVMDHNHAFEDVAVPIALQGTTKGGTIRIEEGSWIGFGAAIVCNEGELVIGRNSVVGANSVVTRSIPPNSVVTGNPARVVKQFDPSKGEWVLGSRAAGPATRRE